MPDINKSSRHSKITGDFAEGLVLYWLSKHSFESASVDGDDYIAKYKKDKEIIIIDFKYDTLNWWTEK